MRDVARCCKNCVYYYIDSMYMGTCTSPDSLMCADWPDPYDRCEYYEEAADAED